MLKLIKCVGHWGTCPGLILVWSHLNLFIREQDREMIFVIGPGHGAPAALASLWIEGSLAKYYPDEYPRNKEGLRRLITKFSIPGGFPRCVWLRQSANDYWSILTCVLVILTQKRLVLFTKAESWVTLSPSRLVLSWTSPT